MNFFIRWPDGYVPEDYGWQKDEANSATPGGNVYARWEIPFKYPSVLTETLHDAETGAVGGWFNGPVGGVFLDPIHGQVRLGDVYRELLRTDLRYGERPPGNAC